MSLFDNIRYKELVTAPGIYIPDVGIDYPEDDPYKRLVDAPITKNLKFDETYPFLETDFISKFTRAFLYLKVFTLYKLIHRLRYGLKFEGRENLRKHKKDFKNGIVSVSNHCYRWDGMAISEALGHTLWIPMLGDHLAGPSRTKLRNFGGIPLPEDGSFAATKKFNEAFDYHAAHKGWIHVFPEARSWFFYKPLRPWKTGAFTMAYRYDFPVLPINLSFRPRTGIFKLFDKPEIPLVTVRIGEPIFPDKNQPRRPEVERLMNEAFEAVCKLGGIEKNSWPVTWNEN